MKKRIVICCDGTWNEPKDVEGDHIVPTNVLKTVNAVSSQDIDNDINQVIFYDQGKGSGALGVLDRSVGGGAGYGISGNIQDCYRFLANNYAEDDEIYLFGFSRGAYVARCLSGMLSTVGLLEKDVLRYVSHAYEYYQLDVDKRAKSKHHKLIANLPKSMPKIKFIGVWDTVGALGVPTPVLRTVQNLAGKAWKPFRIGFHNTDLVDIVENAFQALAIDEQRGPFQPSLWQRKTNQANVQQVWFAGVHSNVGGGYSDSGLSDTAFLWMANRAMECGLVFNETFLKTHVRADESGKLEDSYSSGYRLMERLNAKPYLRPIGKYLDAGEMIHESVIKRILSEETQYKPANILSAGEELQLLGEDHRQLVNINGTRVPVFKEREFMRRPVTAQATVTTPDQPPRTCEIIDLTAAKGARLRIGDLSINAGDSITIESELTGIKDSTVVWSREGQVGVRFSA